MLYRSYFNPQPSVREIMDSVSNFLSGPSGSLKSGAICKCQLIFLYIYNLEWMSSGISLEIGVQNQHVD